MATDKAYLKQVIERADRIIDKDRMVPYGEAIRRVMREDPELAEKLRCENTWGKRCG
ncbi:MAG TPA: hypothetical protein VJO34_14375 [Methylomirabilota bacterium]|nr:hypothetical protein [Methylomirabilota bacterium]